MIYRFQPNRKICNPTVTRQDYYSNIKNKLDSQPARFIIIHKFVILLCQVKLHIIYI
jgi:hypothetical protein